MSAQTEVPVFYLDQDESFDPPCRVQSRDECRLMKKAGEGFFISHGRKFRLYEKTPVLASTLDPSGAPAPSTISLAEMQANVGITESWEIDPFGKIARAREKIRVYPFVGDTQAPLARSC